MKSISIVSLLFFFSSCATYYGKQDYQEIKKIYYHQVEDERQMARAYIPKGAGPFPGVILIHGGGWHYRDLEDMRTIAKSLVTRGFSVLSINYRLFPQDLHPAPILDLENALKYFKLNASRYKLKPDKIGLWGYSSGAHTAAFYALTRQSNPSLLVQAVVAGGGPYDFTQYPDSKLIKGYMGNKRDKMLEQYIAASPLTHVKAHAPPFFLYHAKQDNTVEYQQSVKFEEKLIAHQVKVERYDIEFWGHAAAFIFSDEAVKRGVKFLQAELK